MTEQPFTPTEELVRNAVRPSYSGPEFDRFIAQVKRDAAREAAQMIRDACDRWEADGDDERLVNDVLDPWITHTLTPETEDQT